MVALDYSGDPRTGEVSAYATALIQDHPILEILPNNAPRAVKHIYRASVRLKYLRAEEGWDLLKDWNAANTAWEKYMEQKRQEVD